MNLTTWFNKYFDSNDQVKLIGLQTAFIGGGISLYYLLVSPNNLGLIVIVTGLLINSVMMSATYHGHNSKERNLYGLITALISGVTSSLGSYSAQSLILSSIGILIILPWVGLINNRHLLLFWFFFFVFDGYVLGFGMPSSQFYTALSYGIDYAIGGVLIVLGGVVRMTVRAWFFNIYETLPFLSWQQPFDFNPHKIFYTLGMLIAVLLCNFISIYLHLDYGYWLTMTAFLLFKDNFSISMQRLIHRFFGTLLGGGFAFTGFMLVHNKLILALALFPLLYYTIIAIAKHYGSYTFFLTITVSILINLITPVGTEVVTVRLLWTFIGVLIVMMVLLTLRYLMKKESND